MKSKTTLWQFFGFGFVSFIGTLLHFLYEWTGESVLTAPFSGVNESTWEHMKLLYFPLLVYMIIEYFIVGKELNGYLCIKLCGTIIGLGSIPVLFYTLNGMFGKTPDWLNITIFFISAAITFLIENHFFNRNKKFKLSEAFSLGIIIMIGILFILFTFRVPKIPLFLDPVTGKYGI